MAATATVSHPSHPSAVAASSSGRPVRMMPSAIGPKPRASTREARLRSPRSSAASWRTWSVARPSASRTSFRRPSPIRSSSECSSLICSSRRSTCRCRMSIFTSALASSRHGCHLYPRALPVVVPLPASTAVPLVTGPGRPNRRLPNVHARRLQPFTQPFTKSQAAALPSGVARTTPATATATPIQRNTSDSVTPGLAAVRTTWITMTKGQGGITVTVCRTCRSSARDQHPARR